MAMLAMRLLSKDAPVYVLLMCHGFQVIRRNARRVSAKVVRFKAIRYPTIGMGEGEPVCKDRCPVKPELTVTLLVLMGTPYKARPQGAKRLSQDHLLIEAPHIALRCCQTLRYALLLEYVCGDGRRSSLIRDSQNPRQDSAPDTHFDS